MSRRDWTRARRRIGSAIRPGNAPYAAMSASPDYLDHLIDLLAPLGPVTIRRMFGGAGLYHDGVMFALVAEDRLYLKADDGNRHAFEAEGLAPFTYESRGKRAVMSYYEPPADALEDAEILSRWARGAFAAALRARAKARRKTLGKG